MSYRDLKHDKTIAVFASEQLMTKRDFSDSLWTKFGPSPKGLRLSENATDIKVVMKEVI